MQKYMIYYNYYHSEYFNIKTKQKKLHKNSITVENSGVFTTTYGNAQNKALNYDI